MSISEVLLLGVWGKVNKRPIFLGLALFEKMPHVTSMIEQLAQLKTEQN